MSGKKGPVTLFLRDLGRYGFFVLDCAKSAVRGSLSGSRVVDEAYKLGVRAFPVLATMAIFVGTNLAIQGHAAFGTLGAQNMVGMFVALAGVREVCPLLAATMVAAKGGTEMTAHLAVMRTKEQIDALEVMAVDPRAELVIPSVVAIVMVLPALTIVGIALSILAALCVAVFQLHIDSGDFLGFCFSYLRPLDFWAATAKSVVFGGVIASVSGYFGFHSERGPAGVGKATNRAVVAMCVLCVSVNFGITAIFYG